MIDTVSIRLKYPEFKVEQPHRFNPTLNIPIKKPEYDLSNFGRNRFKKYQQNPTEEEKKLGLRAYLTAYERFENDGVLGEKKVYYLHIEVSLPNLLFGNSVQELDNKDFDRVVRSLVNQLRRMGVVVTEEVLRKAIVAKIHFSKNILLPHPLTVQDALSELYKTDLGKRKDINMRHYGNDGQSLYFYATSENIIFYDKLRDINTPKGRALDKHTVRDKSLLEQAKEAEKIQEILRFEVRLTKQRVVDTFLSKKLGEEKGITFEEIFKWEFCQRALLTLWGEMVNAPANQLALKMERLPEENFDAMIKSLNPAQKKAAHSLTTTLASFGLSTLIQEYGVRQTRNKIEKNWTTKAWKRLSAKIKDCATTLQEIPPSRTVSHIQSALEKFERFNWQPDEL